MNMLFIFGLILLVLGIVVFVIIEFFLYRWLKKYNEQWTKGDNTNDVS